MPKKKVDMYSDATNVLQFKLRMFPTFLLEPQKKFNIAAVFFLYLPGFLHSSSSSTFLQSSSSKATEIPIMKRAQHRNSEYFFSNQSKLQLLTS